MKWLIMCLAITFSLPATMADEIVKWVDENGKVHYGDKVPEQYKDQAEKVEDSISVVGPEDEVRDQNTSHVNQLKQEAALEDYREKREQQAADKQINDKQSKKQRSWQPKTREECRDRYVNRTAARTECFRRVDERAN